MSIVDKKIKPFGTIKINFKLAFRTEITMQTILILNLA